MFIELRRYIVKPEHRDAWVKIMEEKIFPFIIPLGVVVLGSFTALHEKSQYIWLRSFENDSERVRLYKAMYESEYWGKEIIPAADKMLEWEGIKNVKLVSLMHPTHSLFINYDLQKSDVVELKKYKIKPRQWKAWLTFIKNDLTSYYHQCGARVLDSFSLPEFEDTHLLMIHYKTEGDLGLIDQELQASDFWKLHAAPLLEEESLEAPLLVSTDSRKFQLI